MCVCYEIVLGVRAMGRPKNLNRTFDERWDASFLCRRKPADFLIASRPPNGNQHELLQSFLRFMLAVSRLGSQG
jgi:hypothetical protein